MSSPASKDPRVAQFGRFQFNVASLRLFRDHVPLDMQDAATRTLALLVHNAGRTVAYADLTRAVSAPATAVADHPNSAPDALRTIIRQLRQALRDPADHPMYIETIRGIGYRFIAPVRMAPDANAPIATTVAQGGHPVDASPAAHLAEWVAGDAAAIDFAVVWTCAAVPVTVLILGWQFAPVTVLPVALRFGFRLSALRSVRRHGASARELHDALCWADASVAEPNDPVGWRRLLRRSKNLLLLGSMTCFLTWQVAIGLELPWSGSATAQTWWARFLYLTVGLMGLSASLVITDAIVTPRPVLQAVRLWLQRTWRQSLKRRLDCPALNHYEQLAQQEVEQLLAPAR